MKKSHISLLISLIIVIVLLVGSGIYFFSNKTDENKPLTGENFFEIVGTYGFSADQIRAFPYLGNFDGYVLAEEIKELNNANGDIIYAVGKFIEVTEKRAIFSPLSHTQAIRPTISGYENVTVKKFQVSEWKKVDFVKMSFTKSELQKYLLNQKSIITLNFKNPFNKAITINYGFGDHIDKNIKKATLSLNPNEHKSVNYTIERYDEKYYCENPYETYNLKYKKNNSEEIIIFNGGACSERVSGYDLFIEGDGKDWAVIVEYPFNLKTQLSNGVLSLPSDITNWRLIDESVVSLKIPSNFIGTMKWKKGNNFFYEIKSKDFSEIDITTSDVNNSGRFVQKGSRLDLLFTKMENKIDSILIRNKLGKDGKLISFGNDAYLYYATSSYGGGAEKTGLIQGYYVDQNTNYLITTNLNYSYNEMSTETAVNMMRLVFETLHIK